MLGVVLASAITMSIKKANSTPSFFPSTAWLVVQEEWLAGR